jgi:hypothetical protein
VVGLIDYIDPGVLDGLLVEHDAEIAPTRTAVLSPDRAYRYALTQEWNIDAPAATFIMLNPSTADALNSDATMRRCIGFARRWGCGGVLLVNAFALRSRDPAALRGHPNPVGDHNDRVLASVVENSPTGPVVTAWGADPTMASSGRGDHIVALLHSVGVEPRCLGRTKAGNPRHPLFVAGDTELLPYPDATAFPMSPHRPSRIRPPAPRPCRSCPYRQDVPARVWAAAEYRVLPEFDLPTPYQPHFVFRCHQADGRVCAGWAGCHDGDHLLSLRIAVARGEMTPAVARAVIDYKSPVPLFRTGAEAADWGLTGPADHGSRLMRAKLLCRPGIEIEEDGDG